MDRNALLIEKYRSGEKDALDSLVKENERLVWSVVNRMPIVSGEKEDMFQTGCIGLIKAANRFDPGKGVMFSTYAVYMIMGEIKKFIRDDGMIKVSRSLKELAINVRKTQTKILSETGEEATIAQIAERLGKKEEEIVECLEADKKPVSINKPMGESDTSFEEIIASDSDFDEKTVDFLSLAQATSKLSGKEKYILLMRYYRNKTQTQIAEKLGVSQVHVSRLEKKIIETLRKEIV